MQNNFGVCCSHGGSIRLPFLIFVFVSIVANPSNHANRNLIHSPGCFHFQADDVVLVSQLIPFSSILHQFFPRAYGSIPHSSALGIWPWFSFHLLLHPILVNLIKFILLLARVDKRAVGMLFVLHTLVIW